MTCGPTPGLRAVRTRVLSLTVRIAGRCQAYGRMFLELKQIRPDGERIERQCEPSALRSPDDEFVVTNAVDLVIDVSKKGEEYRLRGRISTTLELVCSRCVEAFSLPVTTDFDLRYLPTSADVGAADREIADDELSTTYYHDEVIDLGLLIREQLYLVLPMKPLCRAECAGLCAACGTNRNSGSCACDAEWRDPRLAGLGALLKDRSDE